MFKPIIVNLKEDFQCTAEKAFAVAADLERRPEWISFIEKTYYIDKKPGIAGSRYKEKLEFLGFNLYLEYEIKEFVQNKLIIAQCKMAPFKPIITIAFQSLSPKTCSSALQLEVSPGPLALIPKKLVVAEIEKILLPMVDKFRDLVER
jgi:hypothetical protein